jgi:FtsP/CotA-like multicopper oxidase with cupredoxin domain
MALGAVAGGAVVMGRTTQAQDAATPAASPAADPHAGHGASATPASTGPEPAPAPPLVGVPGQPLASPEVRASQDGVLQIQLEASLTDTIVAGKAVKSTVYEGTFPGPTWSLYSGDTIRLTLINSIDQVTNIHTHGFHVSPKDNSDNIFLHINPGETFEYEYKIPNNHPAGIFWYHPHAHGNTAQQTTAGMVGAIIIKGGLDEIDGIAGLTDRLLFLQSTQFTENGDMVPFEQQSPATRMRLINGQLQPTIAIQPGETQRWRFANASSDDFFLLSLEGHQLHVIAKDGNPNNRVVTVDEILLAPAERVEVLVQATTSPGSFQLKTLPWGTEYQMQPEAVLATMVVSGAVLQPQPLPIDLLPFEDLSQLPVDNYRTTVFEEPGPPLYLAIDGKHFDPDRIDQTVKLGALEEWTVRNTSSHRHPFHIHVNDFQVVAVNGEPVEATSYMDTVDLPPNSEITIRMRFADFDGKFVYHCHILSHEDFGMMATVDVVP